MNVKIVLRLLGVLLLFPGTFMAFCLLLAFYYEEPEAVKSLGFATGIAVSSALLLFFSGNASRESIYR